MLSLTRGALICAAAGAAVTVVELAAARALAPHFGQSVHVWAAVIAVLLGALALGYARGARAAEAGGTPVRPVRALLLGAAWLVAAAFAGPALCRALTPEGLPGPGGLPIGLLGSVVASLLLFAVPVGVVGGVSPWLVRALDAGAGTARGAGFLYAAGTLGSLVGCAVTPLVLLQTLGTRATLLLGAGLLALAASGLKGLALAPGRETPKPSSAQGWGGWGGATALVAGFVTLAAELLAVRLFAPWMGQSNRIWANTIGVILFALALGAWLGERLARRFDPCRTLFVVVGGAAVTLLPAAFLGPSLAETLVPRGIDSMRLLPVAFDASLAATVLLFGVPTLLLGAVPALLVHALAPRLGPGRASGNVSAWGTLGALAGAFAGPLLIVPTVGSRLGLIALAGLLLATCALVTGRRALRLLVVSGGAVALVLAVVLPRWTVREHPGQLVEIESAYQTVRAVRERVGVLVPDKVPAEGGTQGEADAVFLRHDEDAETYQSIWLPTDDERLLSGGRYYEQMALGARLALPAAQDGTLRVLIVGYAGGGVHRILRRALPAPLRLDVVGVEIDPAVVDVARRHLDLGALEGDTLRLITGEDARTVVNALPEQEMFDLVLIDAYARTNYVPFQLATREFFAHVKEHLAPGGWVGVNVLGTGMQGKVLGAVADTLTDALGPTWLHPNVWFPGNVILWASADAQALPRVGEVWREEGHEHHPMHPLLEVSAFALERMAVRHLPPASGGRVLTDDLSPSDRLADEELGL